MNKVVLSGYYGFNNIGDELILYSIIRTLREVCPKELSITVLSNQPEKTAKNYTVDAVSRWSLPSIIKAIAGCELFISGGGSLFQDVTSSKNPLYYLGVLLIAKLMGKKTMVYAQGIGPLRGKMNRLFTSLLLNTVDLVTVRDDGSREALTEIGVKKEIIVTSDPVLGLPADIVDKKAGAEILKRCCQVQRSEENPLLGVFIRSWGDDSFLPELVKTCDLLASKGWKVVFVPMHFPIDISVAKEALKMMRQEGYLLKEMYSPLEMLSVTKNFDLIIGMRLHALINGVVAGVPMVGISYDPKVDRFLEQMGQHSFNSAENLRSETVFELISCVDKNREDTQKIIQERANLLYQKSWQTARLAADLLKR